MLDIRTLTLANSLVAFLCVVISLDVWASGRRFLRGTGYWFLGFLLLAIGLACIGLRGVVAPIVSYGLANLSVYLGCALQFMGILAFTGKPTRPVLYLGLAILLFCVHAYFIFGSPNLAARLVIYNLYNVAIDIAAMALFLSAPKEGMRRTYWLAAWIFFLYGLLYVFRTATIFIQDPGSDLFSSGVLEAVYFLASMILIASVAFVELKLVNSSLIVRLEEGAREKVLLVREMSHRTKNNLALADSLVALEGHRFEDPRVLGSMEAIRSRLRSIGLLHDSLYRLEAVGRSVRLDIYLRSVVEALAESAGPVVVEGHLEEVEADLDTAIPIGLITGELVTNSLKYAYPTGASGRILVSLGREGASCRLIVRDWGRGFADKPEGGLGGLLVSSLAQQLGGQLYWESEGGAVTELVFSPAGPAH